MDKTLNAILAVSILGSVCLPAWADSTNGSSSSGIAAIPKKALGFICGAAVATPVSLVRRIIAEDKEGIKGMVGETDNKFSQVAAGSFWFPFSMILGACEAPLYGPLNSLVNVNKPFSKEQMGLGDQLRPRRKQTIPTPIRARPTTRLITKRTANPIQQNNEISSGTGRVRSSYREFPVTA